MGEWTDSDGRNVDPPIVFRVFHGDKELPVTVEPGEWTRRPDGFDCEIREDGTAVVTPRWDEPDAETEAAKSSIVDPTPCPPMTFNEKCASFEAAWRAECDSPKPG